jgi:hypothetical protein
MAAMPWQLRLGTTRSKEEAYIRRWWQRSLNFEKDMILRMALVLNLEIQVSQINSGKPARKK